MSETRKYIFMHIPKAAGTTITSMLPDQRTHNGPFAEAYHPDKYSFRPKETWPSLHQHTGKMIKEAGQELADIVEEKKYCDKLDHYTLEQRFETGLIPEEEFDKYFSFCFVRNPWDRILSAYTHRFNARFLAETLEKINSTLCWGRPDNHDADYLATELWPHHIIIKGQKDIIFDKIRNVETEIFGEFIKNIHQAGFRNKLWQSGFYYAKNYAVNTSIDNILHAENIGGFGNHLVPQHLYALDKKSMKKVDFVGRCENLENDFKVVAKELGFGKDIALPHLNSRNHRRKGRHYTEFYTKEARDLVAEIYAEDIKMFGYKFGE